MPADANHLERGGSQRGGDLERVARLEVHLIGQVVTDHRGVGISFLQKAPFVHLVAAHGGGANQIKAGEGDGSRAGEWIGGAAQALRDLDAALQRTRARAYALHAVYFFKGGLVKGVVGGAG